MATVPPESDETPRVDELVALPATRRTLQWQGGTEWLQVVVSWVARHSLILAAGVLLGVLAGAYFAMSEPTRYVAEALIAPTRSRVQVQFESTIKTVSDAGGPTGGTLAPAPPERLQSLTELVRSGTVEAQVISRLASILPISEVQPGQVAAHIRGALRPRSEIISIQAEAADPSHAVLLANEWANSYADVVNRLYANGNASGSAQSLEAQRNDAFAQHEAAQDALTAQVRNTRVNELNRAIKEKQDRLTMLYRGGQVAAQSDSSNADAAKTVPSPSGADDYRLVEVRTINDLAQTMRRLDASRTRIQALASESAPDSTDAAAVTLAKAQLVTISDALPAQMQFQVPATSSADIKPALAQLLTAVDIARAQVAQELETRQAEFEIKRATEIRRLEDELRPMQSELEDLLSGQKELVLKRDLAWDTYTALARKLEERKVADAATGHEVEIASMATAATPAPRSTVRDAVIGAAAGLAIAVAGTLTWTALWRVRAAPLTRAASRDPLPVG